jgi:hypothetical protein
MITSRGGTGGDDARQAVEDVVESLKIKHVKGRRGMQGLEHSRPLVDHGFVCDELGMSIQALCFLEMIDPMAKFMTGEDAMEWVLEAQTLRKLAPGNADIVLDEMVAAIASL